MHMLVSSLNELCMDYWGALERAHETESRGGKGKGGTTAVLT